MKKKLCYVLPEYSESSATHFAYLTDFIKAIAKELDIFLIIEKGEAPQSNLGCIKTYSVKTKFRPLRQIIIKLKLVEARFSGYKTFYVHYSFFSAFIASFLGRVFYWNCGEPWKYRRFLPREAFERLVYRRVDFLVTGTESLKSQYSRYYKIAENKIIVMPNWINLRNLKFQVSNLKSNELKTKLNISKDQKVILFVHRLSKRKGAHYLPEILNDLKDEKIVLVVIGDGPEKDNVESKIMKYELTDKVRFLGTMPNFQLSIYYSLADVFIMPSDEEGFPHVLLEAMAMGVPFVASDVGGVREIVPPSLSQYVVSPGNIGRYAEHVKKILHAPSIDRKSLIREEREWVLRYDINSVVNRFLNVVFESHLRDKK